MNAVNTETNFSGLGIAPKLLDIIGKLGFESPTPIQRQSIPAGISGKDLIGIAQTGTGKTLAYGVPMLQRLAITKAKGLVLVPTRELALQVNESLKQIGKSLGLKTAVVIGGESIHRQISALRLQPHVIIATPGRLIDVMEQKAVSLSQVGVLILDEADRMLDMGFAPQLKKIMAHIPKARQTMLFSATMDAGISAIAASYLELPVRIEVAPAGSTVSQITQEIIMVNRDEKTQLLKKTLTEYAGSTLIFCRTKHGAKKITTLVRNFGHTSAEIHSNRSLNQRIEALNGFKIGKYRVLVATDIAARGIDVTNIELVINYDLPEQASDYVHRIGRTARAGKTGHAISFATTDQHSDIRAIERLIKKTLPVKKASGLPARVATDFAASSSGDYDRGGRGSYSRGYSGSRGGSGNVRPQRSGGYKGSSHSGGSSTSGFSRGTATRNTRGGFSKSGYSSGSHSSAPRRSGFGPRPRPYKPNGDEKVSGSGPNDRGVDF